MYIVFKKSRFRLESAFYVCAIFIASLCCACKSQSDREMGDNKLGQVLQTQSEIEDVRPFDIVLRCGRDEVSAFFARLNPSDKRFSHCGIVLPTAEGLRVYHIALAADARSLSALRAEDLEHFVDPNTQKEIALVRYSFSAEERAKIVQYVQDACARGIPFDEKFDVDDTSAMYCSEFLYRIFSATGREGDVQVHTSITGKKYVSPDSFLPPSRSALIWVHQY